MATGQRMATCQRLMTGQQGGGSDARPMTSIKGAGYQSNAAKRPFDPFNLQGQGPAPPLESLESNGPDSKAKVLEKEVHRIVTETAELLAKGENQQALKRAKDAIKKERVLNKLRETSGFVDQINLELTYCVCFSLANAYQHNDMMQEALNTYTLVVRNKQYPHAGRLRVNMGNIYFGQKKYVQAVKMYRMALDQIPTTEKEIRFRIMRNIGNAFVQLGQFQDGIQSYENVMEGSPDFQTGFNLVVSTTRWVTWTR